MRGGKSAFGTKGRQSRPGRDRIWPDATLAGGLGRV